MESIGVKLMALERFKPKDKRIKPNGAAMAGPLDQNPKKRRLN